MIPKDPAPHVFSILRDIYKVPDEHLTNLDLPAYIERIRGIHQSLSAEHEFAAIASWLGNPRLIIHSDEVLATDSSLRVPDFLVVARKGDRDIPFLVEVKNEKEDSIKWSEKYLASLRGFAKLLNLPLLVAWKKHGIWLLCDSELFQKKNTAYHLSFDTAVKNNLMATLFGNLFIVVNEGFRMEIKYELLDVEKDSPDIVSEGEHEAIIVEAGLYTAKGKLPSDLAKSLFPIFLLKATDDSVVERDGRFLRQIFPTDSETMFNASDILFMTLSWSKQSGDSVNWLLALRNGEVVPVQNLRTILNRGIEGGAIQYVFEQRPQRMPSFLEGME